MIQTIGHVIINGETIRVLVRQAKTYRALKLRTSGKQGNHFSDESEYLKSDPVALGKLRLGEVVKL